MAAHSVQSRAPGNNKSVNVKNIHISFQIVALTFYVSIYLFLIMSLHLQIALSVS